MVVYDNKYEVKHPAHIVVFKKGFKNIFCLVLYTQNGLTIGANVVIVNIFLFCLLDFLRRAFHFLFRHSNGVISLLLPAGRRAAAARIPFILWIWRGEENTRGPRRNAAPGDCASRLLPALCIHEWCLSMFVQGVSATPPDLIMSLFSWEDEYLRTGVTKDEASLWPGTHVTTARYTIPL